MSNRLINKVSKKKNISKNINNDSANNINITTSNNCNNKRLTKTNIICNKGLVILQWNAKGLSTMGHGDELNKFVTDLNNKIDIVCIQEIWINNINPKSKKTKLFF